MSFGGKPQSPKKESPVKQSEQVLSQKSSGSTKQAKSPQKLSQNASKKRTISQVTAAKDVVEQPEQPDKPLESKKTSKRLRRNDKVQEESKAPAVSPIKPAAESKMQVEKEIEESKEPVPSKKSKTTPAKKSLGKKTPT